jgi:hypothetical protein
MSRTLSIADVHAETGLNEWTIAEMVRDGRTPHIRVGAEPKPGQPDRRSIRFTEEQVAQLLAAMTVDANKVTPMRRRKRRAS